MKLFSLFYRSPTDNFCTHIWNLLYVFSLRLNDFWLKLLVLNNSLLLVSINVPVLFLFVDSRLPKKIWGCWYRAIDNVRTFISSDSVLSCDVGLSGGEALETLLSSYFFWTVLTVWLYFSFAFNSGGVRILLGCILLNAL